MSELKPCPFCGEEFELVDDRLGWYAKCVCGCSYIGERSGELEREMPNEYWEKIEQKCIDAVNTRPVEDALTVENEALKTKVTELAEQQLENTQELIRLYISIIDKNGKMEFNGDVSEYYKDSNLTSDLEDCETVNELVSTLSELVFTFEQKEKNRSWDKLVENMSNSFAKEELEAENKRMREALKMIMRSDQTIHCLLCHDCAQKALNGGE